MGPPVCTRVYRGSNPIPLLQGMAIRRPNPQDDRGGFMKKLLAISALMIFNSGLALAQSIEPQTRDNSAARYDEPHRNWSVSEKRTYRQALRRIYLVGTTVSLTSASKSDGRR